MPVKGQVLGGKYRLERYLGRGGFASVWAATILNIDRPVALKILSDTFATDHEFVSRFLREARLSARPIHETIIRVEDIGQTEEGTPFLVMELLEGQTLSATLKERGPLALDEALEIGEAVLEGLAAAHRRGIIHRDIKPANIYLTDEESVGAPVRILDLGLGKDLRDDPGLTQVGQMMGTPDYMAPELLLAEQLVASSPASDVFAVGVLFFEMLTGQRPLSGLVARGSSSTGFVERARFYQEGGRLPHCRAIEASVPEVLDDLVAQAVAIDPAERLADAGQMLDALDLAKGELAPTRALVLRDGPPRFDREVTSELPTPSVQADSAISGVSIIAERPISEAVGGGVFVPPGGSAEDSESLEIAATTHLRRVAGAPLPEPVEAPGFEEEGLGAPSEPPDAVASDSKVVAKGAPPEGRWRRWIIVVVAAVVLFGLGTALALSGLHRPAGERASTPPPLEPSVPGRHAPSPSSSQGAAAVSSSGAVAGDALPAVAVPPLVVPVQSATEASADGGAPREDGGGAAAEQGEAPLVTPRGPARRRPPRRRPPRAVEGSGSEGEEELIPFNSVGRGN